MTKLDILTVKQVINLTPTAPFNFDASLHKPDHFPSADNAWQPGVRWQTMLWQWIPLGLKFANRGTIDQPVLELSVYSQDKLKSMYLAGLVDEVNYRYSLQLNLSDFNDRFRDDPHLGPIINRWRGMRPLNCSSLYE